MYVWVSSGELFTHLRKAGKFNNDHTRFYAAQIVMALQVPPSAAPSAV